MAPLPLSKAPLHLLLLDLLDLQYWKLPDDISMEPLADFTNNITKGVEVLHTRMQGMLCVAEAGSNPWRVVV